MAPGENRPDAALGVVEEPAVAIRHVHRPAVLPEMRDVDREARAVVAAEEAVVNKDPAYRKGRTCRLDVHSAFRQRTLCLGENAVADHDVPAVDEARALSVVAATDKILQQDVPDL